MGFLELVKRRRSTRKYAARPVPREVIARCLEAAQLAPSACNSQPCNFIVVDEADLRKQLADAAFSGIYSMNAFAKSAPVLVIAVREGSRYFAALGGYWRGITFSLIDIAIACEHFVLQAEEEGVGTCWLGWFDEKAVKKILGIPPEKKADIMISVGYPEDTEERSKIRKPLTEISRFNR